MSTDYKVVNNNNNGNSPWAGSTALGRNGRHVPPSKHNWIFNMSRFQKPWNVGNVRSRSFRFNKAAGGTQRGVEQRGWTRNYKVQKSRDGRRLGLSEGSRSSIWNHRAFETKYQKSFSKLNRVWYLNGTGHRIYFSLPKVYQISLLCCRLNDGKHRKSAAYHYEFEKNS